MVLTDTAPYGTTQGVVKVMETFRETGLGGAPISPELVARLGFGDEVARRIVLSLRMLDLIDDEGKPTTNLMAFKQAGSTEYKQVFADLLYDAYAPVFAITGKNLGDKSLTEIEDAFRSFRPDSLRKRMVSLFLGLCEYVGIAPAPPKAKPGPKGGTRRAPAPSKAAIARRLGVTPNRQNNPPPPPPPPDGDSYTVTLRSGGRVTLTVDVRLFDLDGDDWQFVHDLVGAVKKYDDRRALPPGEPREVAPQN